MDERFFFNPYMFGTPYSNVPPNMVVPNQNINMDVESKDKFSPKDFYENGYYYYRYLNELMDYQIKSKEYSNKYKNNEKN